MSTPDPDIDELFNQTLSGDYEYEEDAPWEAVSALRTIGTREVFERAAEWCKSAEPLRRARGADILAQLGKTFDHRANNFPEESYSAITALLQSETELQPLASAISALGHLENPLAVPLIANFSAHPHPKIRFSVTFALGCFPNDPLSVSTLRQLMQDADGHIRDWATFGLGVLGETDSVDIREALVRCLNDSDENVREEAMVGLAKRKDHRVLSVLLTALQQPGVEGRPIEAADLLLGKEIERENWTVADYEAALRKAFSL